MVLVTKAIGGSGYGSSLNAQARQGDCMSRKTAHRIVTDKCVFNALALNMTPKVILVVRIERMSYNAQTKSYL